MSEANTNFSKQLASLQQEHFTGRLDIQASTGKEWKLYFRLGRLVWTDGGCHPHRSWRRHLAKYCPQINIRQLNINNLDGFECYYYQILTILFERKQVNQEQVKALITSKVETNLFEIIQQQAKEPLSYTCQPASSSHLLASTLKTSLAFVNAEQALEKTQNSWSIWVNKGLGFWSPNLAPRVKITSQLREEVSEVVYQNFIKLFDGNNTLRDLAFQMNSDILKVACSLIPYLRKGSIELVQVEDITPPISCIESAADKSASPKSANLDKPLIACIDDSPQIGYIMEQIISKAGYQFIGIQEPLQALPKIIASNPDLIFLDLKMPILNGYEICTQLRRVSQLKEIPIIIITGQDGIVDRMRAKVVGASDFLSKPIQEEKILSTLEKFLTSVNNRKINQSSIGESQFSSKLNPAR